MRNKTPQSNQKRQYLYVPQLLDINNASVFATLQQRVSRCCAWTFPRLGQPLCDFKCDSETHDKHTSSRRIMVKQVGCIAGLAFSEKVVPLFANLALATARHACKLDGRVFSAIAA